MERLTADNINNETLRQAALQKAGLLGLYTRAEFDALVNKCPDSWELEFQPTNMDDNTGRVKMRPCGASSVALLDRGRANRIRQRNKAAKKISTYNLIGFVMFTKRLPNGKGSIPAVQDFLLNNYMNPIWGEIPAEFDAFRGWCKQNNIDISSVSKPELLEVVHSSMPRIIEIMNRVPPKRTKPNDGKKPTADEPKAEPKVEKQDHQPEATAAEQTTIAGEGELSNVESEAEADESRSTGTNG